jgi:hypothetical protein
VGRTNRLLSFHYKLSTTYDKWEQTGIVQRVEAVIARQRHGKRVSAAANNDAIIEEAVFSTRLLLGNGAVNTFPQQRLNTQQ